MSLPGVGAMPRETAFKSHYVQCKGRWRLPKEPKGALGAESSTPARMTAPPVEVRDMKYALSSLVLAGLILTPPAYAEPAAAAGPSITVTGTGHASAVPDTAHIEAGVVTTASDATKALAENNQRMQAVLTALRAAGVARQDIQTAVVNLSPLYQHPAKNGEAPTITGYRATNVLRVELRDLDKLATVLDELVHQGANQLSGIRFEVHDPERIFDAARRAAMTDAHHIAELYARTAGVSLGKVLTIDAQPEGGPPRPYARALAAESVPRVPVAAGQVRVDATVRVRYALR